MVAIKGHFDGKVFVPDEPVNLPRGQSVLLHVQRTDAPASDTNNCESIWSTLQQYAGTVEAPADWSAEHDHYLYGTPKRAQSTDK
jgi:hypothetical protein